MTNVRDTLLATVTTTADYLASCGYYISDDMADALDAMTAKVASYYDRVMWKAVRDAYDGFLTAYEFEDVMLKQISFQFRRGWLAGLRELGAEMTAEMEAELQDAMVEETTYVQKLMDDIVQAARDESGYGQFRGRVKMWAHRFDEMRNRALLSAGGNVLLTWEYGATEEHCTDCKEYEGTTRTATEWKKYKAPQGRDLECGGWRCDCRLVSVLVKG